MFFGWFGPTSTGVLLPHKNVLAVLDVVLESGPGGSRGGPGPEESCKRALAAEPNSVRAVQSLYRALAESLLKCYSRSTPY